MICTTKEIISLFRVMELSTKMITFTPRLEETVHA